MRIYLFIILFPIQLLTYSQSENKLIWLFSDSTIYCMDSSEFKLGELDFFSTQDLTRKHYGNPDKIENFPDYNIEKWTYNDFIVDFSGSGLFYITLKNENLATPAGVKIGQTFTEVFTILGETPNKKYFIDHTLGNEIQIANCDYEMYLVMKFNNENILTNLELGIDLP